MTKFLLFVLYCWSLKFGVDPVLVYALCLVESRSIVDGEVVNECQTGRLGRSKYWGPGGINQDCFPDEPWEYINPCNNVEHTARALAYWLRKTGSVRGALRKYNPKATGAYIQAVMTVWRRLEREGE